MHKSKGELHYSYHEGYGYKLVLSVDPGIVKFYRSLIPKYMKFNPQRHDPHISVVRHELPLNPYAWEKYEKEIIEFEYSSYIHEGTMYFWLNAFSSRLEDIREELGLPITSIYDKYVPPGYNKIFHFTLGNKKNLP